MLSGERPPDRRRCTVIREVHAEGTPGAHSSRTVAGHSRSSTGGPTDGSDEQPGLAAFLRDPELKDHSTEEEIRRLRLQQLGGRRPNKPY